MKNYAAFTLEDFVGDDEFRDWVQGSRESQIFWERFMNENPGKLETIRQAEQIVRASDALGETLSEAEIRKEVDRFLEAAAVMTQNPNVKGRVNWWLAAAACLVVGSLVTWFIFLRNPVLERKISSRNPTQKLVQTANNSDAPIRLVLQDSSIVTLNPNSTIKYPSRFDGPERKVYLKGEASFSVTHSGKPFMVCTGDMITKVLGTRFVVRAFDDDKKISVQVQSGKVSVYSTRQAESQNKRERNGVILTANQAAIFEKDQNLVVKTLVANPIVILKDNKVVNYGYDEVPLPTILRELEKVYGIPIQYDVESFQHCRITATFSTESLYEKLELLCKTVSANYEIVDGQIAISGHGCP